MPLIYVKCPIGYEFGQREVMAWSRKENKKTNVMQDVLFKKDTSLLDDQVEGAEQVFYLQAQVKEWLNHRAGQEKTVQVGDDQFILYFDSIPLSHDTEDAVFLHYKPNNNGALPALTEPTEVIPRECQKPGGLSPHTQYGQRWFQPLPLSEKKLKEVHEKDRETQDNKRHWGDSPKPT